MEVVDVDGGKHMSANGSFVDEYLNVSSDGLRIDWDRLNSNLKRYKTDGGPILTDEDVKRVKAQLIVSGLESAYQKQLVTELSDARLLAQVEFMSNEKWSMKYPLSDDDRKLGNMNRAGFERLVDNARGRADESAKLYEKLELLLLTEMYSRSPEESMKMGMEYEGPAVGEKRFDRAELEIALRRAEELRHPASLRWLSNEELKFMEYEGNLDKRLSDLEVAERREGRYHVARVICEHDKFLHEVFGQFPAKTRNTLPADVRGGLDNLGPRLRANVETSKAYLNTAMSIANEEPLHWSERPDLTHVSSPSYTLRQVGVIREGIKIQDAPWLRNDYTLLLKQGKISDFLRGAYAPICPQQVRADDRGGHEVCSRGGR